MAAGIVKRHSKRCARRNGGKACSCNAGYEAWVYIAREKAKVRRCFRSRSEAKAWRDRALEEAEKGILQLPNRDPRHLGVALEQLIEGMREGRIRPKNRQRYKPSTVRNYDQHVRRRISPMPIGSMRVREIRRLDVQEFVDELIAEGLSPSTVYNILNPIQTFYRRAEGREEISHNPTLRIELPSAASPRPKRIASREEAAELLAPLTIGEKPIWATAFYAGLRRGELQALRCCDVDLSASSITVERAWDQYAGIIEPKSEASWRTIPLLGALRNILDAHMARTRRKGDDLLFGRMKQAPFVPSTINKHAQERWEALRLRPITLHECRHTFASLLIDAGANPKALQTFMGHSHIQTTFDIYGHLLPGSREEVRLLMDEYLAQEARNAGAQTPQKLAHLAHRPNLGHFGNPSTQHDGGASSRRGKPDQRKTPRSQSGARQYRYGDSNPGFWHEKPAS
jgi:integrase